MKRYVLLVLLTACKTTAETDTSPVTAAEPTPAGVRIDPLPPAHGFIPRDAGAKIVLWHVNGTANIDGCTTVVVDLVSDGETKPSTRQVCATTTFSVPVEIPVALKSYDLHVHTSDGTVLGDTTDVVVGDVFLVQGQSNAVAADISGVKLEGSSFIRSYGSAAADEATSVADNAWHTADANAINGPGTIGQWEMKMAKDLLEKHSVPLAILNGADNGKPIEWFQRNDRNHGDTTTNYGRLLRRAQVARLRRRVRAIFYFQGESDGANADAHRDGFTALYNDWHEDFPGLQHVYVTQVRPGCGEPSVQLRNEQRRFATTLVNTTTMSTSAMDAHDGCHYKYEGGYELLGAAYARQVSRDIYGVTGVHDIDAIDVMSAWLDGDTITIATQSDATAITADAGIASEFAVEGRTVTKVTVDGSKNIVVTLSAGKDKPTSVSYVGHQGAGPKIVNANGIGMLTFILPL